MLKCQTFYLAVLHEWLPWEARYVLVFPVNFPETAQMLRSELYPNASWHIGELPIGIDTPLSLSDLAKMQNIAFLQLCQVGRCK